MWKAIGTLLFKLLASAGAFFVIRQGGKTSQKLKAAEKGLKQAGEANEIDEDVARMSTSELDDELRNHQREG